VRTGWPKSGFTDGPISAACKDPLALKMVLSPFASLHVRVSVVEIARLRLTGLLVTYIVGRRLVDFWVSLLQRIPLVRSIYSAAKSFAEVVFTSDAQSFKQVLLIEYPRKGIFSLGFQTAGSGAFAEIEKLTGEEVICVFVPTTPNPTSGFIMLLPKQYVIITIFMVDR